MERATAAYIDVLSAEQRESSDAWILAISLLELPMTIYREPCGDGVEHLSR